MGRFHRTFFAKQKVAGAQRKNYSSISPTFCAAKFAKDVSSYLSSNNKRPAKNLAKMLMTLTTGVFFQATLSRLCYTSFAVNFISRAKLVITFI